MISAILVVVLAFAPPPDWPAARSAHAMVYHDRLGEVLLLGGVAAPEVDHLWAWNGERWRTLSGAGPTNRGHFAFAYDARRDRVVLQGGSGYVLNQDAPRFRDTWEWDGARWRQVATDGGPGQRDHHAMVYDAARQQLVLFGGADSTQRFYNDTWTWDGRSWRKLADGGPPARATHRMVYDERRRVVVLFGGWGEAGRLLDDTWEWDGTSWKQVNAPGPGARYATRLAYDAARGKTVLFGGRAGNNNLGDTWIFDGTRWQQIEVTGPPMRNVHELVYDPRRLRVLLFGGFNAPQNFNDLWQWDGARWQRRESAPLPDPPAGFLAKGPHRVGYRVLNLRDFQRTSAPKRDFEGKPNPQPAAALQINLWYPAGDAGAAFQAGDYRALDAVSDSLGSVTPAARALARDNLISVARFGAATVLAAADADAAMNRPAFARMNAPPAAGRFPLVVGGMEGAAGSYALAEYLASHGYVVATARSLSATRTEQATKPGIALDAQAHRLEAVFDVARQQPFVDAAQFAVIGLNFDGLAALIFQLRNMSADAVITLDGWENKPNGLEILRGTGYLDPVKLRVPYLTFQQDNSPSAQFAPTTDLFDQLKYSSRHFYVLEELEHLHLLLPMFELPHLTSRQQLAYDFYYSTIRDFLDAFVKNDAGAVRRLNTPPEQRGYPAALFATKRAESALPAVPTAAELEALVMSGNIAGVAEIFRQARRLDPDVQLFTRRTLNLYVFRFTQSDQRAVALALMELGVEAFPNSSLAHNDLGNAYRDMGQTAKALASFERALALVDSDAEIAAHEKQASRDLVQRKIDALRRTR